MAGGECGMETCVSSWEAASSACDESSLGKESAWASIDHAERCLLSAAYQEAADLAISALRTVCQRSSAEIGRWPSAQGESSSEGHGPSESVLMIEAAGMVLLQALNEMGRPGNIFEDLLSVFDSMGKVPYPLILTGICIQLPGKLHPLSERALEEYLSGWKARESNANGQMVQAVEVRPENRMDYKRSTGLSYTWGDLYWSCLARTDYLQLAEIYVIEILAKLHKNPGAAGLWIRNSNIAEEDKQVILAKLQLVSQSQRPSISCNKKSSTDHSYMTSPLSLRESFQGTKVETLDGEYAEHGTSETVGASKANTVQQAARLSEESTLKAVAKRSGIFHRFPFVQTVLSLLELTMIRLSVSSSATWTLMHHKLPHHQVLLAGAFSSVFVYALLRNWQYVKRLFMEVLKAGRICFGDLWQLAFSVHLNSLAAVQPLPSPNVS